MSALETLFQLAPQLADGMTHGPGHVMVRCPFHSGGQEKTPSMSISTWKPVYWCFAGETRVLTREGPRPIRELAGEEHDVLVPGGYWVRSPFYNFGVQELWEITLSRNGIKKTIRATKEHRWFVRRKNRRDPVQKVTADLTPKDILEGCFPVPLSLRCDGKRPIKPSAFGIARGFVYGDGSLLKKGGSVAYFYGKKDEVMRIWFPLSPISMQACVDPKYGDYVRGRATDLPSYFKSQLPELSESVSYIYGWLAGYFAADGDITEGGHASFNSANLENLQRVRDLCTRVGIATTSIKSYRRRGIRGEVGAIYRLSLFTSTVTKDFFLLPAHRERFTAARKEYERRHWQIVGVRRTKVKEPVYCATVPHPSHAFALEDNILTGNCHACETSGHLSQLLRRYGLGSAAIDIILPRGERQKPESIVEKIMRGKDPFRGQYILDEGILDRYRMVPVSLRNAGYTQKTLRHFEVGFDQQHLRITYPLRTVFGDLVGISGRAAINGVEPRYKIYDRELKTRTDYPVPEDYTMEEVKSAVLWHAHVVRPLFFLKNSGAEALTITEGFKATMWTYQAGVRDTVALVGSYLTPVHAELIARATKKVVLFLDNNAAGYKGTERAGRLLLKKGVEVCVASYPDQREQPDDLSADEVTKAVNTPQSLRSWLLNPRNVQLSTATST